MVTFGCPSRSTFSTIILVIARPTNKPSGSMKFNVLKAPSSEAASLLVSVHQFKGLEFLAPTYSFHLGNVIHELTAEFLALARRRAHVILTA